MAEKVILVADPGIDGAFAVALALLDPRSGETWVDATLGAGGHARLIAERVAPDGRLVGLDQDPTMLALARPQLEGLAVTLGLAA